MNLCNTLVSPITHGDPIGKGKKGGSTGRRKMVSAQVDNSPMEPQRHIWYLW